MSQDPFRIVYPLESFDGGLNNKYEPNIIADNESPDCLNVVYDDRGGVQTRGGMSKANSTSVGSHTAQGLFTARFNDRTEKMIGVWNGTFYTYGTNTFVTIGSGQSVYTAGTRVDGVRAQNYIFFGNGYSQPYKYNGTEFTRHGVTPPNSTATAHSGTAGANGAQTGDVNYLVTYRNSALVESDISSATATLTLASTATVSLVCLPVAPTSFGINARRVYRRDAGTATTYKLVTTIADNTTTTYTDSTPSASLGAVAPTDQGLPPVWKFAVSFQERLFMVDPADPMILYYSELGEPYVVKADNFIPINDGDGEVITALAVHANMLVVGKEASTWFIYMPDTDPANWIRIKSTSPYGWASHFAKGLFSDRTMFLGKQYGKLTGFMVLEGTQVRPNETDLSASDVVSDSGSDKIEPDVFNFTTTNIDFACGVEFKNKLRFAAPYSNATNNRVYEFDYQRRDEDKSTGSWVPHQYPVGFNAFTVYNSKLYAQAVINGFVYELDTSTYSDDGTAINSYDYTKEFVGHDEDQEHQKDFRHLNLVVEPLGSYNMTVGYAVDGDAGAGYTQQVSLTPTGTLWGTLRWGEGNWSAGQASRGVRLSLGTLAGKRVKFSFSNQNTVGQGFHVLPQGSFTYNRRGRR